MAAQARLMTTAGRWDEALEVGRQAVAEARRPDEADALLALGALLSRRGEVDEARDHLEAALARVAPGATPWIEALLLLGGLDELEGAIESARRRFQSALDAARRRGDRSGESAALRRRGRLLRVRGRLEESEACYARALPIDRARGAPDRAGRELQPPGAPAPHPGGAGAGAALLRRGAGVPPRRGPGAGAGGGPGQPGGHRAPRGPLR